MSSPFSRPSLSLSPPSSPFLTLSFPLSRYPYDLPQPLCLSLKAEVKEKDSSGRGRGGEVWEGEGEEPWPSLLRRWPFETGNSSTGRVRVPGTKQHKVVKVTSAEFEQNGYRKSSSLSSDNPCGL
jgi:hypothetical protein